MVAVGVVQAVSTGLRRYAAFRIALRTETDLRQRLFAHLQRLHFAFHDQSQTGQLMARANTDIQQVETVVILIPLTAASCLTMVGVLTIMVIKSPVLALLGLGALPFLNIAATRFSNRIAPVNLGLQQELARPLGRGRGEPGGRAGGEGLRGRAHADEARSRRRRRACSTRRSPPPSCAPGSSRSSTSCPTLSLVAILWYGGHQVLDGQLQVGDILAFNLYILMLIWPLRMIGMLIAQASRASAGAGRVHEILVTDPEIIDRPNAVAAAAGARHGDVRGRALRVRAGPLACSNGLDLTIRGGEAVALVGATGSGKTTVARLLPRFYDVEGGRVLLDGVDVRDIGVRDLRKSIGIVFEDTFLFSDTVRENIAFANPEASAAQVRRAARLSGADAFIDALPDGYDTVIGEHGFSLSGGQRQRIAIARAVHRRPEGADPRRRDLVGRPHQGARDPRRARRGDGRPDDDHHRPPARDDRPRRSRRAAGRRSGRCRRHARGAARDLRALPDGPRAAADASGPAAVDPARGARP